MKNKKDCDEREGQPDDESTLTVAQVLNRFLELIEDRSFVNKLIQILFFLTAILIALLYLKLLF